MSPATTRGLCSFISSIVDLLSPRVLGRDQLGALTTRASLARSTQAEFYTNRLLRTGGGLHYGLLFSAVGAALKRATTEA